MSDSNQSKARIARRLLIVALAATALGPAARGADYLIDPNYNGVNGQPQGQYTGVYNSIVAALSGTGSVASGASAVSPNRLFIQPGTYNTASVTGVSLSNSKNNMALVGMSGNPDDVVITSTLDSSYNPGSGALGTTGSSTLQLKGNNVSALGITFANSTDTPYIATVSHQAVSPQGNYATGQAQSSNSPAVALLLQGDQQAFKNCKFLGYQDTLYTKGGRSYFTNCTVSGDIDFIFANGTTVLKNSQITLDGDHSGGTIFAPSTDKRQSNGMVVLNCQVTGNSVHGNPVIDSQNAANVNGPANNSMNLGRPWGWQQVGGDAGAVFVNTTMSAAITKAGWLAWNSNETNSANGKNDGNPAKDSRFAEYNSTTDGVTPFDVSQRVAWSHQLTPGQAAAYTVANIFSPEGTGPNQYPWYGVGYPASDANNPGTGSPNPNDVNYSWPAFWGDRNSNNDTSNATVSQPYPTPGNPAGYTNPNWTIAGSWDPEAQLATVPEPAAAAVVSVVGAIGLMLPRARRRT
jgi:pectinesterase